MAGGAVFGTDMLGKLARALMLRNQQQQQAPGMYEQPFSGPTNTGKLPEFEQPGSSLPMQMPEPAAAPASAIPRMGAATPMPPVTVTAQAPRAPQMPQAAPVVPPMAAPVPVGMDVKPDVLLALQQMQQQGKLPEMWKGSFSPGYGEPT